MYVNKSSILQPLHVDTYIFQFDKNFAKMKSEKKVKDSPSALAFTSPEKRQVTANLVETQNIIKKKFKKAYLNRMKREREWKKVFKPITTKIDESTKKFEPDKKKRKRTDSDNENDDSAVSEDATPFAFRPSRQSKWTSSTPRGILQKSKGGLTQSEIFQSIIEPNSSIENLNKSKKNLSLAGSPRRTRSQTIQKKLDLDNYSYKIVDDLDKYENYTKFPSKDLSVILDKKNKTTGQMERMLVKYNDLPVKLQKEWTRERRDTSNVLSPLVEKKTRSKSSSESGAQSLALQQQKRSGRGIKPLDFNFIPYNKNSEIVYEYFDDPNEICDRLRLLISSRMAGNNNHIQEINSIIEELRELGYIV